MTNPTDLLQEIEALSIAQRVNRAKVNAKSYGHRVAILELRRVAHEIKLKAEHFRALTSPSLDPKDAEKVDADHLQRWAIRKWSGRKVKESQRG